MGFPYYITLLKMSGEFRLFTGYGAATEVRAPDPGCITLYERTKAGVAELFYKNDANVERDLSIVAAAVTGTGVANQLAIFTGAQTIGGDTDLTFVTDTLTATKIVGSTSITDSGLSAGSVVIAGTAGLLSQDITVNHALFWDATNHRLGIGTGAPINSLHIVDSGTNINPFTIDHYTSGISPFAQFRGRGARGSITTPTQVLANDQLTALGGAGWTSGSVFTNNSALIALNASENFSGTNQGTFIAFHTTPTTSITRAEAMRVTPLGGLDVGQTTDITAGVVSVLTGYRIGNAAASGNVLRGNGTNFVSSTLAFTDITGSVTDAQVPDTITISNITQVTTRPHSSLTSLVSPADDHTQYAFLTGRSGGQSLIGGTAASNSLTLQSSSNATRGNIILVDQVKFSTVGNETTGGGSALLGANSPAVTNTAPYTWEKVVTSDGSAGFIPVWK